MPKYTLCALAFILPCERQRTSHCLRGIPILLAMTNLLRVCIIQKYVISRVGKFCIKQSSNDGENTGKCLLQPSLRGTKQSRALRV